MHLFAAAHRLEFFFYGVESGFLGDEGLDAAHQLQCGHPYALQLAIQIQLVPHLLFLEGTGCQTKGGVKLVTGSNDGDVFHKDKLSVRS